MKRLFSIVFGAIFIALIFLPGFTKAQEGRIAITPLVFDLTGERGEKTAGFVRVINHSNESTILIQMEIEDMFPEGEEGRVRLQAPEEDQQVLSLSRWITLEPVEFPLAPKEEKIVRFAIDVPSSAEPGGHYAAIVAGTRFLDSPAGVGVGIRYRIGALLLVTVPGETKEELTVIDFQTPSYQEKGPIEFIARFENTGTIHVTPDASIEIFDIFGRKVDEIPLESRRVLPKSIRKIEAIWDQGLLWGIKYRAVLKGTYGSANFNIEPVVITFWGFSWKVALAIVLALLFFFITRKRWRAAIRILVRGEAGLSHQQPKV